MNKKLGLMSFLLLAILFSSALAQEHITSYRQLKPVFENPSAAFRPAPFWVWHDKLQKDMLERDLNDFKENGFGGVFMHPRYGLITEYLSDEWFEMVEFSVNTSKSLGLKAWIYDENSFPSGFAGGHVAARMPESYNQGQGLVMHKMDTIPDNVNDFFVVLKKENGSWKNVTEQVSPGETGTFRLFEKKYYRQSKWHAGYSYVDLLIPGVTDTFINVTMEGYERVVGDEFGGIVPGVFTDEPNIRPPRGETMRWTPALFDEFEQRWGYDLVPHLPSILEETGDWQRVRHNYYELLLELFIENWSKPWYRYCEENDLQWTGHYWEHGWPNPQHGGDNMAMYAWHQVPAIDMLFNNITERPDQFGNIRAVKELASVANQLDRNRALSETYGAAGWELRFEDMKRLGDWEYVLGVNFMNQHLAYMNMTGDRKHDFPQGISYQTPWWEHYHVLNDYFARLSAALSAGEQINDILVLEPTTTTWMYYSPAGSHDKLNKIGDSFHDFVEDLEHDHIEYDVGCENIIKDHGKINDQAFVIGERSYQTVVLPPFCENLDQSTFELLDQYVKNGGRIIAFSEPKRIDGELSDKAAGLAASDSWLAYNRVTGAAEKLIDDKFVMEYPDDVGGQVFHMRRELQDGQIVFLSNFSLKETGSGSFVMPGASAEKLDAFDGERSLYPVENVDDKIRIQFDLPPANSLLLFISDEQAEPVPRQTEPDEYIVPTDMSEVKRLSPNMLTLDYCNLVLGDSTFEDIYFYTAGFKIWQKHGYRENPWVSSSQFKTELVDADTFGVGTGFEAYYPFTVDANVDLSSLRAVVERPNLWQVQINGQAIEPLPNEWAIDKTFGVFDISDYVETGENQIGVVMHPMSIFAEIEPVYITGDFDLQSQDQGWIIVPATPLQTGSWKEQGCPFYPYDVAHEKNVILEKDQQVKVRLNEWEGTVSEVRVNGTSAGIIGWPPYECDISPYLQDGENRISVIVTGSFKNLLGPHHNVERRGIVTPWSFKYAPAHQPAGVKYDQLDYGLFEDFEIVVEE